MVAFKNFEASVHVDGTALVEYEGDEDDNGVNETNTTNTVTRYIEAIAGKAFVIKYAVRSGLDVLKDCDALRWTLVIDGKLIKHGIWSRTMLQTSPSFCQRSDTSIQNEDESGWTEREFTFGNINLRDVGPDEALDTVKERYKHTGEIQLECWLFRGHPGEEQSTIMERKQRAKNELSVPEKAVKGQAISLATSYGTARSSREPLWWTGQKVGISPEARFIFKYRSHKDLQDLLILPRTPSPVPLEDRPTADLTSDELRELVERQRSQLAASRSLVKTEEEIIAKRERDDDFFRYMKQKRQKRATRRQNNEPEDSDDEVRFIGQGKAGSPNRDKNLGTIDLT